MWHIPAKSRITTSHDHYYGTSVRHPRAAPYNVQRPHTSAQGRQFLMLYIASKSCLRLSALCASCQASRRYMLFHQFVACELLVRRVDRGNMGDTVIPLFEGKRRTTWCSSRQHIPERSIMGTLTKNNII